MLALSTATPTAVFASEPDTEQEGTEVADPTAPQAPAGAPDVDPGGSSTDLPVDVVPVPAVDPGSAPDDGGPLEQEPATDAEAPSAEAVDAASEAVPSEPPAATAPPLVPAPAPAATAPEPASSNPQAPTEAVPTAPPMQASGKVQRPQKKQRGNAGRDDKREPRPVSAGLRPTQAGAIVSTQLVSAAATPSASATSPSAATVEAPESASRGAATSATRAKPGDRTHVVAPGESLWSIAADVLDDDASVAQTAREVNRLWELNARRIGTGNPSLVHVGTTLLL